MLLLENMDLIVHVAEESEINSEYVYGNHFSNLSS